MKTFASRPCERGCGRQAQDACSFPALQRLAFARRPSRPSLKAVKEKMGGKKPACFSVRKREIKKRKNHRLLRFLLRFFVVKNVPLTKERSEFPVQGSPHAAFLWRARLSRKFPLSGGSLPARLVGRGRLLAIVAGVVGGIAVIVFFRYVGIVFHAVEHRAQNGAA